MSAKVVIECYENIPCNPCVTSCPFGAISKQTITSVPEVDESKCTGCTICVSRCPGLAMFVIEEVGDKAHITLPYEFLPLPERGEKVKTLNREGKVVGEAEVVRVLTKGRDRTAAVTIEVPVELAGEVRNFRWYE
ncbi:MAG: 4Fe-4S binding protein [Candidatus Thermoplasmatota archaeon]|nr:4Fe-4S binding protein [Candidatus Thermoplasmatota archaeon]